MKKSKKTNLLSALLCILMCILSVLTMSACDGSGAQVETPDDTSVSAAESTATDEYAKLWADATYVKNTTLGEGKTSFNFDVTVGARTVSFNINTDEETVGAALLENGLIAGDEGDYGMYVKTVNGIFADYDVDGSCWIFYENGEYAMSGVDRTTITSGATYAFVYTK